jgi:hypothetical protein
MKPKKISVNPLYQRHPRSINPYTDLKAALSFRCYGAMMRKIVRIVTAQAD